MEILTIVLANIRHKKGTFIGISLLMLIIAVSIVSVISINDNNIESAEKAHEYVGTGDITMLISSAQYTDELREMVKNHKYVQNVDEYKAIMGFNPIIEGYEEKNTWYMVKLREGIRLFNEELDGYVDTVPELKAGEIYITQGILTNSGCKVGDKVIIETSVGNKEFIIKGIIVEPVLGAATIGWKQVFISDEEHDAIIASIESDNSDKNEEFSYDGYILNISKKDDLDISSREFKRQLNEDTGIEDKTIGVIMKEDSIYYTNMYSDVITSVLLVFMCVLVVIVLIVMCHSITTSIEMDYTNLGILKSQGFSNSKLRLVLILQYIIAEVIGIVTGIVLSIPIVGAMGNVFQPISGILSENNMSIVKSMLIVLVILVISVAVVYFTTRKISRISPVKAITGGKDDVYFDSRIKAPITKRGLMVSIAFRQFTSNLKKYIGAISIVSILVLFMMTASALSSSFSSKAALEAMGETIVESAVYVKDTIDDETLKDIESIVEKYSEIEKKYYQNQEYVSLNGDSYQCMVFMYTDFIMPLEGREPRYDNEIVITPILAEELGLKVGDKVTVSNGDSKEEFIISGFFQSMMDLGKCFAMSLEGGKKIGINDIYMYGYSLKNPENAKLIADEINGKYSDVVFAEYYEGDMVTGIYADAITLIQIIIYTLSVVFAIVVVAMVCSKLFLKERKDIGIYKAVGFTVNRLRLQFAIRFLLLAIIGSIVGYVLSMLFTEMLLGTMLRTIGICSFKVALSVYTIVLPIVVVCLSFFVFAYIASRKVKTVQTRELVME